MKYRVGIGYDVHKLEQGTPFFLGGIEIESPFGAVGHSDADVLIHAIIDSLLGAANLRDIGYLYPDTKKEFKGIDSKILLKDTIDKVREKGFKIENLDTIICLQSPKISSYIPQMQETLSKVMQIELEDINIKATTTEHLGFVGKKEGVAAHSVCLLSKE
ncbi:MAG: 2-C-methyl-D-erythritol 2,4-cyclodiphosphate synthase [Bacteroidales bacterium]|jgi:2-C-methyl-D-erythritol 2,4-cyclodiphosphate synthase|nr:2-C-methyl-D-erythritol 2,4-cyclodiphosphate synthase [Bacteroidales bacterium]MDD4703294.1 2-C-methyl-D-erythritol 2,4-cyclodiphosphate synthase [Bacteroidales bacterium]MDX9797232.1 2-C-methyl-D-erythritol 2,4-cyclodiphosphate synthase [Bacteroidales bacterium]